MLPQPPRLATARQLWNEMGGCGRDGWVGRKMSLRGAPVNERWQRGASRQNAPGRAQFGSATRHKDFSITAAQPRITWDTQHTGRTLTKPGETPSVREPKGHRPVSLSLPKICTMTCGKSPKTPGSTTQDRGSYLTEAT